MNASQNLIASGEWKRKNGKMFYYIRQIVFKNHCLKRNSPTVTVYLILGFLVSDV